MITNELGYADTNPSDCRLDITGTAITFTYVTGHKAGRRFMFTPADDADGWSEMLKFAQALVTACTVQPL